MKESATRRLLRCRDTMDRHFASPLDVAALARVAVMSPPHFTRSFRATFGETPHQYLYRRRIERAAWLLRTTDLAVTDIGQRVGYESLGTFTQTFTRLIGETPTQHRARGPFGRIPGCVVRGWNSTVVSEKRTGPTRP